MQSTRLPGKVLFSLPQPNGKVVLEHILDQIKKSNQVNAIVMAIPEGNADDILCENIQKLNKVTRIIRGSEQNVLQRFLDAVELFPSEYIVRLTGDNPLVDASVIDKAVLFMKENSAIDYVQTTGLPLGLNIEVVKVSALKTCATLPDLNDTDKEHVTLGIRSRPHMFNVSDLALNNAWNDSIHPRCTLDTIEDYTFLNAVFYGLSLKNYSNDILHLKKILNEAPWMTAINKDVQQKHPESLLKEAAKYND